MRKEETTIKMKRANLFNTIIIALIMILFLSRCGKAENETNETDNNTISWFENSKDGGLSGTIITYDYKNRERKEDMIEFRLTGQSYIGEGRFIGIIYDNASTENHIAVYDSKDKTIENIISINSIKERFDGLGCSDNQSIKMSDDGERVYFQGGGGIIRFSRKNNDMELLAETYRGDFFITSDESKLYYLSDCNVIVCKDMVTGEETNIISEVFSFDISSDEESIVYSDTQNQLIHYDIDNGTTVVIKKRVKPIPVIYYSKSGDKVMFTDYTDEIIPGSCKTKLYVHDLNGKKTKLVHKGTYDVSIAGMCWAED